MRMQMRIIYLGTTLLLIIALDNSDKTKVSNLILVSYSHSLPLDLNRHSTSQQHIRHIVGKIHKKYMPYIYQ